MRALLLGTLLVIGLISRATAQLAVGPVPIVSSNKRHPDHRERDVVDYSQLGGR